MSGTHSTPHIIGKSTNRISLCLNATWIRTEAKRGYRSLEEVSKMHRGCEYPSIHLSVIHLHIQVSMFVLSCQSSAPPPTHSNMQNFLKRIRDACYSNYVWCQNWGTLPNNEGVLFETRKQHLKSRLTQETGHFFFDRHAVWAEKWGLEEGWSQSPQRDKLWGSGKSVPAILWGRISGSLEIGNDRNRKSK